MSALWSNPWQRPQVVAVVPGGVARLCRRSVWLLWFVPAGRRSGTDHRFSTRLCRDGRCALVWVPRYSIEQGVKKALINDATPLKTRGEIYEGIAFQFCKVATVALICGRFALPVASGLCAVFYVMAIAQGKRDTRCFLRHPWLIASLWGLVSVASLVLIIRPELLPWRR